MSSTTRISYRTVHEVSVTGDQTISLDRLLGDAGRRRLQGVLDKLVRGERLGCPSEAQAWLDWERVKHRDAEKYLYRLSLPASVLTSALRDRGVESLVVDLAFGGDSLMEASHACRYSTEVAPISGLEDEVQRVVNRSINNVLSIAISQGINERLNREPLKRKLPVQNVRQRMTNQLKVENLAYVRTQAYLTKARAV
jgi:hypothetical protein